MCREQRNQANAIAAKMWRDHLGLPDLSPDEARFFMDYIYRVARIAARSFRKSIQEDIVQDSMIRLVRSGLIAGQARVCIRDVYSYVFRATSNTGADFSRASRKDLVSLGLPILDGEEIGEGYKGILGESLKGGLQPIPVRELLLFGLNIYSIIHTPNSLRCAFLHALIRSTRVLARQRDVFRRAARGVGYTRAEANCAYGYIRERVGSDILRLLEIPRGHHALCWAGYVHQRRNH